MAISGGVVVSGQRTNGAKNAKRRRTRTSVFYRLISVIMMSVRYITR